jgi:hypothetical protein
VAFDSNPTIFIRISIKIISVGFKLNWNHFWYNSGYIFGVALTFGAFIYSDYLTPSLQYNRTLLQLLSPTRQSSSSFTELAFDRCLSPLQQLKAYIEEQYEVVFSSQQSYYELFEQAKISWKKTQKCNPKTDPELVKKNSRTDRMARISSSRN